MGAVDFPRTVRSPPGYASPQSWLRRAGAHLQEAHFASCKPLQSALLVTAESSVHSLHKPCELRPKPYEGHGAVYLKYNSLLNPTGPLLPALGMCLTPSRSTALRG